MKPESKKVEEVDSKPQKKPEEKPSAKPKPSSKSAPLKREKSDLFSSFAKAKPKQKKEDFGTPAVSGAESVSATQFCLHVERSLVTHADLENRPSLVAWKTVNQTQHPI